MFMIPNKTQQFVLDWRKARDCQPKPGFSRLDSIIEFNMLSLHLPRQSGKTTVLKDLQRTLVDKSLFIEGLEFRKAPSKHMLQLIGRHIPTVTTLLVDEYQPTTDEIRRILETCLNLNTVIALYTTHP